MKNTLTLSVCLTQFFLGIALLFPVDKLHAQCSPDVTPPTAVCGQATLFLNSSGVASLPASQVDNGSFDNCPGGVSLFVEPSTFNCLDINDPSVTLTVTDQVGNTSTCSATVSLTYFEAPDISCGVTEVDMPSSGTIDVDLMNLLYGVQTHPCFIYTGAELTYEFYPKTLDCSNIGINVVQIIVTDEFTGLTDDCVAGLFVNDPDYVCCDGPPIAICANATIQLNANGNKSIGAGFIGGMSDVDCGILEQSVSPSTFNCSKIGPNTVTYTVEDVLEFTSTCTAIVTVEDDVAPNAKCQAVTVSLDNSGNGTLAATEVNDNSTDACGIGGTSVNPNAFNCSDLGNQTVTLEVTDNYNNTSTCTAVATVEDAARPTISCPSGITVPTNQGECEATFMVPLPTANDNCAVTVLRYRWREVDAQGNDITASWSGWSTATMQTLELGYWKIQWQAKDASNNQRKCTFIVEVIDMEAPNAVCFDPIVEFNGEVEIFLTANQVWDAAASSDNCDIPTLIDFLPASVTCDQLGTVVPVTVMIEDASGNPASCTANVMVGGLPCGWSASPDGINCPGGNQASYDSPSEAFFVSSEGCFDPNFYSSSDSHGYVGTELCGDGEIIAQVTQVSGSGWAGISMREDLTAGSKMLQLSVDGVFLTKREMRLTTNALAFNHLFQTQGKNWLRLTRSGNQFTAQHSTDGINWALVIIVNIPMSSCIEVGLFTENSSPTGTATGTFENVDIKPDMLTLSAPDLAFDRPHLEFSEEVSVYPNPAHDEAWIDLGNRIDQKTEIEVFNNMGQLIHRVPAHAIESNLVKLQIQSWENGLYLVRIKMDDKEVITKRLIRQKP